MAEQQQATQDGAAPKKKRGKLILILILVVVLLGGGGAGFYFGKVRAAGNPAAASAETAKKDGDAHGEGDENVKHVIELAPFIVNLADKNESRYLRMTISLGVDEAEEKVDPLYTTKIRNAILATVTNKTSEEILTTEGKAKLREEILGAAKGAAKKPEVLAIYITDFIVQM
jgi:flagellar FliL protein